MLLWIGAILCFIAYAIEWTQSDEPTEDNVCINQHICQYFSFLFFIFGVTFIIFNLIIAAVP